MAATRSDRSPKLTALARQVALQSSPQSAKNEIHQKFAVSGVDQDTALSYLWKNDRYRSRSHRSRTESGRNRLTGRQFLCASGTIERAGIRTTSSALTYLSDATALTSAPSWRA
jgi:hypothetical protein